MSITSKAKRDARKKKQPKAVPTKGPAPNIQPHAHLLDGEDHVIGGAGLRGAEWIMVIGGQIVAGTDSAGMTLAMLQHVAALREAKGLTVQLNYSTQLRDGAIQEALALGLSLESYLALLEQERLERAEQRQQSGKEPSQASESAGGDADLGTRSAVDAVSLDDALLTRPSEA